MSGDRSDTKRKAIAIAASVPLVLVGGYFGLFAALTLLQQVLAGFIDFSQASWTSFLNPAVWLGLESLGGTGGPLDALFGGPGAPGGTAGRYVTFMVSGIVAGAAFTGLKAVWRWAGQPTSTD